MKTKWSLLALLLFVVAAGLALAGTEIYKPYNGRSGYQDIKLDPLNFVVIYSTPIEGRGHFRILVNPEPYNFYRCAELAVSEGYPTFLVKNTAKSITDSYYTVSRTIELSTAPKALNNPQAFDARMVLQAMDLQINPRR